MVNGKGIYWKNDSKTNIKTQEHSRKYLSKRKKTSKLKLMVNITYYPVFQNRNKLQKLNLLLACDMEHKVFPNIS